MLISPTLASHTCASFPGYTRKVASLVNTAVSLGACPAIVYLSDASPVARALVAVSVIGFGLGTTLGLHWFTSPYVHELQWVTRPAGDAGDPSDTAGEAPSGRLRAKTLSLLGRQRWTEFELREVAHPDSMRPLATFKVCVRRRGSCVFAFDSLTCFGLWPAFIACLLGFLCDR